MRDRLNSGGGPFLVIAHSQGSMVAYSVLRKLARAGCEAPLFITIGSPLGLAEVQDELKKPGALKKPECVARWVNVAERLDPLKTYRDKVRGNDVAIEHTGERDRHY